MELTWAGVLLLLSIIFTLISSFRMYKKKGQLPPGPTPWPILGNLFQRDVLPLNKSFRKLTAKYGPIFTVWIGSKPMVALCGYEMVKDALINQAEEFGARTLTPLNRRVFQNKGFDTTDERKWKELRRFTLSTLRDFGMGKKRMSERVQEEALCLVEEIAAKKGQPFDLRRNVASAVSNVICAVVFGNRFDYKDHTFIENQQTVESQIRFFTGFLGLVYNTFPKIMECFPGKHIKIFAETEKLHGYIREEVELHKKTLDPQNPRDYIDCFLHRMEKDQNSSEGIYSPEELVITVFGLFTAGTVITSHTLFCSLLAMAKLQHIQAKVQQEIDEAVGTNRTPSIEDRLKMPFTNAVIHEVQRYRIGSAESFPRATTCDVKFHGYNIPKYMAVAPVLFSVHYDPLHWETPEKFNPDHFLDEKGQFRKKDAFMPFSAGKRACPGEALARMELFLFFSTLLQKFTFYLDGDTKDTDLKSFFMVFKNNNQYPLIRAVKRSVDTCVQ
ncbi:cytochrome P450 2C20-like isoform X1 [Pituophis catenifer annectens]